MCKILHVSDFHMNKDYDVASNRLGKLIYTLQRSEIHIDYLVFTGDLIDAKTIALACIEEYIEKNPSMFERNFSISQEDFSPANLLDGLVSKDYENKVIEEYNQLAYMKTIEAYEKATDIFENFVSELHISDSKKT